MTPLEDFFAGPGGLWVVVTPDGVYGPFHNLVVAQYWREDAQVGGRIWEIQQPWKANGNSQKTDA